MITRPDEDEVQPSKTEYLFAAALGIFVIVEHGWFYYKIGDWFPDGEWDPSARDYGYWVENTTNQWIAFGFRAAFVVGLFSAGLWLVLRMRTRNSGALPLAWAALVAGVVMILVLGTDYSPADYGPLVLSVIGIALTIASFVWLQRYLVRRLPARRVRKGECPYCGYPVTDAGQHCAGCGRDVWGDCSACSAHRRVGSTYCVACGAN